MAYTLRTYASPNPMDPGLDVELWSLAMNFKQQLQGLMRGEDFTHEHSRGLGLWVDIGTLIIRIWFGGNVIH